MAIAIDNLKPHLTVSLFRSTNASLIVREAYGQLERLCQTLQRIPVPEVGSGKIVRDIGQHDEPGLFAMAGWYRIENSPSWLGAAAGNNTVQNGSEVVLDQHNHLVLLVSHGGYLIVYASQEGLRARMNELILFGLYANEKGTVRLPHSADGLSRAELEQVFVRGSTKSAWLEGLHTPTVMKADRKILSGPNLRYALDSYGDQTFTYNAVVSDLTARRSLPTKKAYRVGLSHTKQTIWTGPTRTFAEFITEIKELIRLFANIPPGDDIGVPCVARPIALADLAGVSEGFDVGYEAPPTQERDIIDGGVAHETEETDLWQKHGRFQVVTTGGKAAPTKIVADAYYFDPETDPKPILIAQVSLTPSPRNSEQLEILHSVKTCVDKDDRYLVELDRSLAKRTQRFTLRYGSGHIVQGGVLYTLQFRDTILPPQQNLWVNSGSGNRPRL